MVKRTQQQREQRGIYPGYLWRGDHDPVLDAWATFLADLRSREPGWTDRKIHEHTNISRGTLLKYAKRETKRPSFTTIAAGIFSLGGTINFGAAGSHELIPIPYKGATHAPVYEVRRGRDTVSKHPVQKRRSALRQQPLPVSTRNRKSRQRRDQPGSLL